MTSEYPSLLRSEEMSLVQLYIPSDVAHHTVQELGELGRVEFKDLNPDVNPFQRTYVSEIRRLDEMERRLRFLTAQIHESEIYIRPLTETMHLVQGRNSLQLVSELETILAERENRMSEMNESQETLQKRTMELEEARHVLRETAVFFSQAQSQTDDIRASFDEPSAPLLDHQMEQGDGDGYASVDLDFVAGTIERSRMATFERVLWRVLRGNLYMNFAEIQEPFSKPGKSGGKNDLRKNVFIIFGHGRELLDKIRKISESMGGTLYPVDSDSEKRNNALREVSSRLEDLSAVLHNTSATRKGELSKTAETISAWWQVVRKEKATYHTMNLFQYDRGRRTLIAEGWVPTRDIGNVQMALRRATTNAGSSVPPILHELRNAKNPPTFHRTNKVTEGFQAIIDAYGIADYQEINPGIFAVITFPFLFAVMFGDIGHGFIMAMSAAAMIFYEKKIGKGTGNEIFDTAYFGRYIILLMGLFAMYTGLIYNDIFSLSLVIGKSGWSFPAGESVTAESTGTVYPFGLDPAWHGADNALIFTNSLKMKMSIILGVIHMSFAICLQVPNFIHFGKRYLITAVWLPQILFMESIFGYLVLTVLYKWATDWSKASTKPPDLLNMLIYMFLSPGTVDPSEQLYAGQGFVQVVLILLALVCVPWMLLMKPYIMYKKHQAIKAQGYEHVSGPRNSEDDADAEDGNAGGEGGEEHEEEFQVGEIMIEQVIHTIEFCLGCISNTASYLRLWALSLAHAQLSEVLWTMTIKNSFSFEGPLGVFAVVFMFAAWFALSVAILVVMEGLSAFLHALRLHWVESNGKHYGGSGTQFMPLNFVEIEDEEI
ncbi:uncharacterized protein L969DRAFT_85810 [Mixia osmundae IAM 14324]|uniref:V-type proton ATPase subunit a n=1 Tax=Mixia osmundae (strain CBS 9802 / IAM 14324 / JCM 22182 / KY 12970) TaxID=764103 RepID=G7E5Y2_MIXOS|nr:uncharacterized protein L969DRAFT_85810 [Mixia osmundae IAM 14324]KEI40607.1 hypothetical protein L969DRAFT_85810 [Mixia osmundae IAM 14324]GAA98242.1 hypothetical protein E5Q_04925 [Mixia osmundae IAM 14324]